VYSARKPDGGRFRFGTSGLLYRSNKLMVDRQTGSLWGNLTGEPVLGPLAKSGIRLPILAATVTTWGAWRRAHPATTVLRLTPEHGERWGFRYLPGLADRARSGVSFPVWLRSGALPRAAEVYGLRHGAAAKAYLVDAVLRERVVHDRLGDLEIVLIGEATGAVRAYRSGGRRFGSSPQAGELRDAEGGTWRLEEEALVPIAAGGASRLERVPGHLALWFAWYGFFPHTEVYPEAKAK
jgi:hypothetical protein